MSVIDLSTLPAPIVLKSLDFEDILENTKLEFIARHPGLAEALDLESEPLTKLLEILVYRILNVEASINDAAKSVFLAYAEGTDLDHLAALYGITRLVLDPGDISASPPVPAIYETDTNLRTRTQEAPLSFTTAGSKGSYVSHGLAAASTVKSINVSNPSPNAIDIFVLSGSGDGTATAEELSAVDEALNAETVRPLGDVVSVATATITNYTIEAVLDIGSGPDSATVLNSVIAAVEEYANSQHRIGASIRLPAIHKALMQEGVENLDLIQPSADIVGTESTAPYLTNHNITTS